MVIYNIIVYMIYSNILLYVMLHITYIIAMFYVYFVLVLKKVVWTFIGIRKRISLSEEINTSYSSVTIL